MIDDFDAIPAYSAPVEEAVVTEVVTEVTAEPLVDLNSADIDNGVSPALDSLTPLSWCEMFSALPLSGIVRTVASYCVPIHISDDEKGSVTFALADDNTTLFNEEHPARLAKGLSIYYGKPLTVKIQIVEDWSSLALPADVETPADYRARIKTEVHGEALSSLQEDDNVKSIIDAFDGELDADTVRSL